MHDGQTKVKSKMSNQIETPVHHRSHRILWLAATLALLLSAVSLVLSSLVLYDRAVNKSAEAQTFDLGKQIESYLMANPSVIITAVNQLEANLKEEEVKEKQDLLVSRKEEIFASPADPVGGNPEGNAAVVEFFDYNCPYCRKAMPVMKELEKNDANLRIVYKEFPILGPGSEFAARAALAAARQGKYFVFHDAMMSHTGKIDEQSVLAIAEERGLDVVRLKADMADPEIEKMISRNMELAQELGITGTPGFIIGQEIIGGLVPLRVMQDAVARARNSNFEETSQ